MDAQTLQERYSEHLCLALLYASGNPNALLSAGTACSGPCPNKLYLQAIPSHKDA